MFWNKYPYTDFHELNLDWILKLMMEMHKEWDEFTAVNKITNAGAWDITKQYQAWTIVSDNNIGYISLKPVPVGVAITNTEYWGVIADYNILITDLSNRISTLERKVYLLENRKFIFIGDSYGEQGSFTFDVWSTIVPATLGLTEGVDYWKKCVSGSGFHRVATFQHLLELLDPDIDDKESITDIYVFGGSNDSEYTQDVIEDDIAAFMLYAKANYPRARVTIGHAAQNWRAANQIEFNTHSLPAYANCGKYGAAFAPIHNSLADYSLLGSDGVHPNQDGQIALSNAIVETILGNAYMSRNSVIKTVSAVTGTTLWPNATEDIIESEENGFFKLEARFPFTVVNFTTPFTLGQSFVQLLKIDDQTTSGVFPRGEVLYAPCIFKVNVGGGFNDQYFGILRYNGNTYTIDIRLDFTTVANVQGISVLPFNFYMRSFGD